MNRLDEFPEAVRRRIEKQIAAEIAAEQERRAAALTQPERTDATATPPDAAPCACDICRAAALTAARL